MLSDKLFYECVYFITRSILDVVIDSVFLLETPAIEAFLLVTGPLCLCCVRQRCGWIPWLWRTLHTGVGVLGRAWVGYRQGTNMCTVSVIQTLQIVNICSLHSLLPHIEIIDMC